MCWDVGVLRGHSGNGNYKGCAVGRLLLMALETSKNNDRLELANRRSKLGRDPQQPHRGVGGPDLPAQAAVVKVGSRPIYSLE